MKDIISKRRKELGLTQQQLAEQLNISDKVVSKWETGKSLPDTSMLIPLAKALQLSVNELIDGKNAVTQMDKTAIYEANVSYKNACIIAMTMQLVAAILVIAGRVLWDRTDRYETDPATSVAYILIILGVFCEIAAIAFYLIKRNTLLAKYPARTDCDKKYIKIILCCTYPLILAVILAFLAMHGLSTIEQLMAFIISAIAVLLPFAVLFIFNQKRKD